MGEQWPDGTVFLCSITTWEGLPNLSARSNTGHQSPPLDVTSIPSSLFLSRDVVSFDV